MGIIRNFIDVIGITPESELPKEILGQIIQTSESEKLFIENKIEVKSIYQIIIDIEIKSKRYVVTPLSKLVIVDVIKKIKMMYYDNKDRVGIMEFRSPYNFFIDIENKEDEIKDMKIYVADAYFELVSSNILYNHILYIMDIHYFGVGGKTNKKNYIDNYSTDKRNYYESDIIINPILKEVSISEDNKVQVEEERQLYPNVKNELIDIEAEYL